jgi:hypothetical protein
LRWTIFHEGALLKSSAAVKVMAQTTMPPAVTGVVPTAGVGCYAALVVEKYWE